MSLRRQTVSYLIRRLEEAGVRPSARRGQSFLTDQNLLDLLVETARIGPDDVVLEIGAGMGALTGLLAQRAAAVVSVEVDGRLRRLAAEELAGLANVTLLEQDALQSKNRLDPALIERVGQLVRGAPGRRFKVAANLPYQIATPVISNLLLGPLLPVSITVTIQKELADRILAAPGGKDYGALSVWVQSQCDARLVRVLPPSVFWPRPKVHSAIIQILPAPAKRARIPDPPFFQHVVRTVFLHRRKRLRGVLQSAWGAALGGGGAAAVLEQLGARPDVRAEQLDVERLIQLVELLRGRLRPGG